MGCAALPLVTHPPRVRNTGAQHGAAPRHTPSHVARTAERPAVLKFGDFGLVRPRAASVPFLTTNGAEEVGAGRALGTIVALGMGGVCTHVSPRTKR